MADAGNNWALLPVEIICILVNFLLSNEDLDAYVALRGVCRYWRSVTAGPAVDGTMVDGATDPLFMLSKWAMVTQSLRADAGVTFVNLSTGRFLSKRIPLLLRYSFLGATGGGLLVLGERQPPHLMRVFNPLTGAMARFNVPVVRSEVAAVAVTPSPLMVFISDRHDSAVTWADQNSKRFYQRQFTAIYPQDAINMTPFAGEVHLTNWGSIISTFQRVVVGAGAKRSAQTIGIGTTIPPLASACTSLFYLVESAGELLLVSKKWSSVPHLVYQVDMVKKVFEPVSSIGNRALFVSSGRCFSVDADKFPGVEPGRVYSVELSLTGAPGFNSYKVTILHVAGGGPPETIEDENVLLRRVCFQPASLVQVFAEYCKFVGHPGLGLAL